MDPDAAYERAIHCAIDILDTEDPEDGDETVYEMVEAFLALDGWLRKGGALPSAWRSEP